MAREFADALPFGAARGRGAQISPGNRFEGIRLHVLGEHLDEQHREHPTGVQIPTQVLADQTRTLINPVNSPDLSMKWTINPYRGCEHGCIYCYARPGHEYLGMSCGIDFETKILAKHDAPEILRRELAHPMWTGESIAMSGVTDCYQPLEGKLQITRRCLEIMAECRQPVGIVTKNYLVTRDLDLIGEMWNRYRCAKVAVSITTLDGTLAAKMEPRTSTPRDRLRAIRRLSDAGVPVIAMVAPIIPGLNDVEIPRILKAAADHGARSAGWVLLRLPYQIKTLFFDWLMRHFPEKASRIESLIRQTHGGKLYEADFGLRQRGRGLWAEQIGSTFKTFAARYGMDNGSPPLTSTHFRRPNLDGQMGLFEE